MDENLEDDILVYSGSGHSYLACGECNGLLAIVSPENELSKELEKNGGTIDQFLILECRNKVSSNDKHTRIVFDLLKIREG